MPPAGLTQLAAESPRLPDQKNDCSPVRRKLPAPPERNNLRLCKKATICQCENTMPEHTAFILAGGLGTRLRGIVPDRQKVVARVAGAPFLCRILDQVAAAGITEVILCVGHQSETVREQLQEYCPDNAVRYSVEDRPLGTAGALRQAVELTDSHTCLVMNGDSFLDTSLTEFLCWQRERPRTAAMLLTAVNDVARYGEVTLSGDNRVTQFREKSATTGPGLINAGIYLLPRNLIQTLPPDQNCSLETHFFPALVQQKKLFGLVIAGRFIDIGTPDSYQQAQTFFQPGNNHV